MVDSMLDAVTVVVSIAVEPVVVGPVLPRLLVDPVLVTLLVEELDP